VYQHRAPSSIGIKVSARRCGSFLARRLAQPLRVASTLVPRVRAAQTLRSTAVTMPRMLALSPLIGS
jgi:hypothetical protein